MSQNKPWSFPKALLAQPEDMQCDLEPLLDAVVALRAEVPEQAFTANTLGTSRAGSGVVLDARGTVLTIGYLITEAQTAFLTTRSGQVVQAVPLAYDQVTGFGLLKALGPLNARPARRAQHSPMVGDTVFMISHGGQAHALKARLADRRPFAGYWEYLLEAALYTTPPHPEWSGAGLFNAAGELIGIGSLLLQEAVEDAADPESAQGNMVVPIDLLDPILESLISTGQSGLPPRPWLGLYAAEDGGQVIVGGVADKGPAMKAGLQQGDLILDVAGNRVHSLATFLRTVWALGPAGVDVPMKVGREGELLRLTVRSLDRNALMYRPGAH